MNEVINRFVCSFDVSVYKMGIQFELAPIRLMRRMH